ncbi:MAG: hypothetical protein E7E26_02360 [Clostridiales bacterium]|nr:hypothetical protein [Flavonifractor sp.]MDU2194577.1 hypothetical protein [Clostridiales bacterium]
MKVISVQFCSGLQEKVRRFFSFFPTAKAVEYKEYLKSQIGMLLFFAYLQKEIAIPGKICYDAGKERGGGKPPGFRLDFCGF